MNARAVIFDFDGVLIDSESIAHDAWMGTMGEKGAEIGKERLMAGGLGLSTPDMLKWLEREHGWRPHEGFFEELSRRFSNDFGEKCLIDGARGTLELLGFLQVPFALATNSGAEEMAYKLGAVGLSGAFGERAHCPQSAACPPKPSPDLYIHAAKSLGQAPADCIVIEDSSVGTTAAVRAGCTVWGLTATHHHAQQGEMLLKNGAERIFASHRELQEALIGLFSGTVA